MKIQSQRNIGIDLLKIVSMFMVVILHILGQGGILNNLNFSINYQISWLLEILCYCAVNCFALCSGFIMSQIKFKYTRIFKLWITVFFYSFIITLLFYFMYPGMIQWKSIVKSIFPVVFTEYWYFTAYVGMYFFIPYLNKIIHILDLKESKKLILTILIIFSVIPTMFMSDPFHTNFGYSMIWLCVLYIIGGLIRKNDSCVRNISKQKWLGIYFLCCILTWISKMILSICSYDFIADHSGVLIYYTSPTIILSAVSLLLFFSNLNIQNRNVISIVNNISPLSFSVYLIHTHPLIFNFVLGGCFVSFCASSPFMLLFKVMCTAIVIFAFCLFIDFIRKKLFDYMHLDDKVELVISFIGNRVRYVYDKKMKE